MQRLFSAAKLTENIIQFFFGTIGKVNAAFKTLSKQAYKFIDDKQTGGTNYYRVKAVRKQGNTVYFNIIAIKTNGGNLISISNTNVPGMFLIKSEKEYSEPFIEYNVFNSAGSKVCQGKLKNSGTKILSEIDLSFLKSGVYFVRFNSQEEITGKQIVILH